MAMKRTRGLTLFGWSRMATDSPRGSASSPPTKQPSPASSSSSTSSSSSLSSSSTGSTGNNGNGGCARNNNNNPHHRSNRKVSWLLLFCGAFVALSLYNSQRLTGTMFEWIETSTTWTNDRSLSLQQDRRNDHHSNNDNDDRRVENTQPQKTTMTISTATTEASAGGGALPDEESGSRSDGAVLLPAVVPLEFVHIPKTGGTAVEYAASLVNVTWGLCHWKARPLAGPGCHHPDFAIYTAQLKNLLTARYGVEGSWELWHTPPSWMMSDDGGRNGKNAVNNIDNPMTTPELSPYHRHDGNTTKTLFAIVRNPYERFISEYYCPYNGVNPVDWSSQQQKAAVDDENGTTTTVDPMGTPWSEAKPLQQPRRQTPESPESLNKFLLDRLRYPAKWTAHYLPQSDFIFAASSSTTTGGRKGGKQQQQLVQHVLKYENLATEFRQLMEMYHLPIQLSATINNRSSNGASSKMTVHDLYPETIRRINQIASTDFTNFGYQQLDPQAVATRRRNERTIGRIYYINLAAKTQRRNFMESWLSQQAIPYQRVNATVGPLRGDDCVVGKQHPERCRGIVGLVQTELDLIHRHYHHNSLSNHNNVSSSDGLLTMVLEDDFIATRPLQDVVDETLKLVPADWDIIRYDCWGDIPASFDVVVHTTTAAKGNNKPTFSPKVFRTVHRRSCVEDYTMTPPRVCWFTGGTHAMLWRPESVDKLAALWSQRPYDDIDFRLSTKEAAASIKSYCVNNIGIGRLIWNATDSSIPKLASSSSTV